MRPSNHPEPDVTDNTTKPTPEEIAKSISLADQIAHVEFCAEEARHVGYAERAMELAVLRTLNSNTELLEALKRAQTLVSLLTVRQVIEAGDEAIEAAGLNPWCMNEGLAEGHEHIGAYFIDAAIAKATGATP